MGIRKREFCLLACLPVSLYYRNLLTRVFQYRRLGKEAADVYSMISLHILSFTETVRCLYAVLNAHDLRSYIHE